MSLSGYTSSLWSRWLPLVLFASVAAGLRAAEGNRVIFIEDFENYSNTEALRAAWHGGMAVLDTNAPGGGKAACGDGGSQNFTGGFSVRPTATNNLVFCADIYDFATNSDKRLTVMLRNDHGDTLEVGYIPKSPGNYAVHISGFATPVFWTPFGNRKPTRGWHRFQAVISMTNTTVTLDPGLTGWEARTLSFDGPPPKRPFNMIRFGGLPKRAYTGPMLVDNIELDSTAVALPQTEAAADLPPMPLDVPSTPAVTPAVTPAIAPIAPAAPPVPVAAVVAASPPPPILARFANYLLWWIFGALILIAVLLGAVVLMLGRAARAAGAWSVATVPPSGGVKGEQPRAGALAELTEFAKQALVQGLYSQRKALIETQRRAEQELNELEARLTALHLPLQDRIRVYEKRIAELEKELETRGAEMRELTQVTLRLVREKLAQEKARAGSGWWIMEKDGGKKAAARMPDRPVAKLIIRCEGMAPEAIELKSGPNTFGRASENDFKIEHATVSRFHCEVTLGDDGIHVRDLDSNNGTFIDDRLVQQRTQLRKGQVLRIGDVQMEVKEAPKLASDLGAPPCANHLNVPAILRCTHCGRLFCGACVHILNRMNGRFLRLCPSCSGHCEPIEAVNQPAPPGEVPGSELFNPPN